MIMIYISFSINYNFVCILYVVMKAFIFCESQPTFRRNRHARLAIYFSLVFICLILPPRRCRRDIPPKHPLTFDGLHGLIPQKTGHYILYCHICSSSEMESYRKVDIVKVISFYIKKKYMSVSLFLLYPFPYRCI
jgi:hypothetical protein